MSLVYRRGGRLSVAPGQTGLREIIAYRLEDIDMIQIVATRKVGPILAEPAEDSRRERTKP